MTWRVFLLREAETAWALAIGFMLSMLAGVARAAAPAVAPAASPVLALLVETPAFAGAMGGLVAALVHFSAIALAPVSASRRDVVRALLEGVFSVVVGAICAHFATRQVAHLVPQLDAGDRLGVGFLVGVLAWRVAPVFITLATDPGRVQRVLAGVFAGLARQLGGSVPPPAGGSPE